MTPSVRPPEQLLILLLPELPASRLLCNTLGRAQFAAAFAQQHGDSQVTCWFLDLYQRQESQRAFGPLPANLRLICEADPPAEEFDLVAWGFHQRGDGELAREMLQAGHQRLVIGGRMIAATDNPRDRWLHQQMDKLFAKVTRRPSESGVVYLATKTEPLRKVKNYAAEFAFRDGERLIHLRTRPGVFSHRELDGGARALIKALRTGAGVIADLGCGSGAVGIAAALRGEGSRVHSVDSNPRAIEATRWAAERNGLGNRVIALLDCDGNGLAPGVHDLVLANPPYFSGHRIDELFVAAAERALAPGGRLLVVTKLPEWFEERLRQSFAEVRTGQVGHYVVVAGRRG
jgi:16S rRNA G1207 methylase RsmC